MRRFALLFLAFAAAPALAGGEAEKAPADPLAQAAKQYAQAAWPASGPERRGVVPQTVQPTGWDRVSLTIDARRGEAQLGFAPKTEAPVKGPRRATATLKLRVHDNARTARRALLGVLAANQTVLTRETGWGEVGFGKRTRGRLGYLAFAQGNITAVVRAPGLEGSALATAAQAAIQSSAPIEPEVKASLAPRLASLTPGAKKGRATVLTLKVDPTGPAAPYVALDVAGGSALATRGGYLLYAKPGEVQVTVSLCSKELRVRRAVVTIRVP